MKKRVLKYIAYLLPMVILISACEKDITIDLPQAEEKIVVEGNIEQGSPPIIFLSKSVGYFEPTDINTVQNLIINGADVTISNGALSLKLDELCSSSLPDTLKPIIAELLNVPPANLDALDLCVYTTFNTAMWGEVGKTYSLTIKAEGKTVTGQTTIPQLIIPDSVWYKDQPGFDDRGYIWLNLNDPSGYNGYRVFTKRLGVDNRFIPTLGSVFDDKFFDGKDFDLFIQRGSNPQVTEEEDAFSYYFQSDTVVMKFCSIDQKVYDFYRAYESEIYSNGNPFASPAPVPSNLNGQVLGVWAGYGVVYDTLILKD